MANIQLFYIIAFVETHLKVKYSAVENKFFCVKMYNIQGRVIYK